MTRPISHAALIDLMKRSDELGEWHATFPGKTPADVLNILATQQKQVERLIDARNAEGLLRLKAEKELREKISPSPKPGEAT